MSETKNETKILTTEDLMGAIDNSEVDSIGNWDKYRLNIHWLSPVLGTTPADNKSIVAWKSLAAAKDNRNGILIVDDNGKTVAHEEGVEVELSEDKQGHTAFWKRNGKPCVMSYHVRGFINNATLVMKEDFRNEGLKLPSRLAGKDPDPSRIVRNNIKVEPFAVEIADQIDGIFGRPVRAMTLQGPRISINVSEVVLRPKDSEFVLFVRPESGLQIHHIKHVLDYGLVEGISQWRSGGWGKFRATIEKY